MTRHIREKVNALLPPVSPKVQREGEGRGSSGHPVLELKLQPELHLAGQVRLRTHEPKVVAA
jgi:hypothetical protein